MLLLITADAGRARFFTADDLMKDVVEVATLVHPEARLKARDVWTDQQGRRQGASMAPKTMPREVEDNHFARDVAAEAKRRARDCEAVYLAAPPRFLGRLRTELDGTETGAKIAAWISKDLTSVRALDVAEALMRHVPEVRLQAGAKHTS